MPSMTCYFRFNDDEPENHPWTGPCGSSNTTCCDINDICLEDGVCKFGTNVAKAWKGSSGYYLAGCMDSDSKNPACPQNCTAYPGSDIVYNYGEGYWQCCGSVNGSDQTNCSLPQGKPMTGVPAPGELKSVATIVATGSFEPLAAAAAVLTGSTSTAALATAGSTLSSSPDSNQMNTGTSGSGLSPGAAAGIAIAALLGFLLVVAGTFFLWRRSRQKGQPPRYSYFSHGVSGPQMAQHSNDAANTVGAAGPQTAKSRLPSELPGQHSAPMRHPTAPDQTGTEVS